MCYTTGPMGKPHVLEGNALGGKLADGREWKIDSWVSVIAVIA